MRVHQQRGVEFVRRAGFALLLCDLDNLKTVNDTRGHDAGDKALQLLADGLRSQLRRSDEAYRIVQASAQRAWDTQTPLRELLAAYGIRHLTTQPYRPRTNGKVERFIQTLEREWAYGLVYTSSDHRCQALPHWLDHYNTRRPHSSLDGQPPISRAHNLPGQDS